MFFIPSAVVRIQLQVCFQLVQTIKMPGYGTTSTASWLCGGWGWLIGRMQTEMRIRPKPTSLSRYVKVQHKPLMLFVFFHKVVVLNGAFALLLCLGSVRVFPAWSTWLVPMTAASMQHVVCSVPGSIPASMIWRTGWQRG